MLILCLTSLLALPWLLPDVYFFVMSIFLLIQKNRPIRRATDVPPLYGDHALVTLLIPTYNNSNTVLKQLIPQLQKWILENTPLPIAVILVDSSTDGTEEKIRNALLMSWDTETSDRKTAHLANLTLIHLKNRQGGKAWAINKVALDLKARYFGILDSDWVIDFENFAKAVRYLNDNPKYAYAQMAWRATDAPLNFVGGLDQVSIEYRHQLENRVRAWQNIPVTIHGTAVAIRTKNFQDMRGFSDSVLSEDVDMAVRLMLNGQFGAALCDLSMQQNPCDHLRQFFWQKARWAEGRSEMLRKYALPILHSSYLSLRQKLFWIYYLAYFGRCVGFTILLVLALWGLLINHPALTGACMIWMVASLVMRVMNHMITLYQRTNRVPLICRLVEPFSFYGIGLIYSYTFFSGFFKSKRVWRVVESRESRINC